MGRLRKSAVWPGRPSRLDELRSRDASRNGPGLADRGSHCRTSVSIRAGGAQHFVRHTEPSTTLSPSKATYESSWASGPRSALSVSSRTSASSPVACWSSSRVMVRRMFVRGPKTITEGKRRLSPLPSCSRVTSLYGSLLQTASGGWSGSRPRSSAIAHPRCRILIRDDL